MSLKDEAAACLLSRTVDTNDDRRVGVFCGELGAAGMPRDCSVIHVEAIERETFVPEGTEHEILDRVLCAAKRAKADQRFRKFYLFGKTFFDGGDNAFAKILPDGHAVFHGVDGEL